MIADNEIGRQANEKVSRIKSLNMENFRGIKKLEAPLNTDADIVLLTGPNGFGKTSVIDSICLLLTGFYYKERPFLLYKGEGSGWIEANEMINGREQNVKIDIQGIKGGSSYRITSNNKTIEPKEDVAKASFYYFDLLKNLFDEENNGDVTLRSILCPVPYEIDEMRRGIKSALSRVRETQREYTIYYEDNIKAELKDLYNGLSSQVKAFGDMIETLNIDDRNFLKALKEEYNSALEVDDNTKKHGVFGQLEDLCNNKKESLKSDLDKKQKIRFLVESLPDGSQDIFGKEALELYDIRLNEIKARMKEIEASISKFIELETHFNSRFNDRESLGLAGVLTLLKDNIDKWVAPISSAAKDLLPPDGIMEWLYTTKRMLFGSEPDLEDQFTRWRDNIRDQRQKCEREYSDYKAQKDLLEKEKRVREEIISIGYNEGKTYSREEFLDSLYNDPKGSNNVELIELIDRLLDNIKQIKETLSKILEQENRLKETPMYKEFNEKIERLSDVLESESSTEDSVIQYVLGLSKEQMEIYQNFVNSVFQNFRLVEGLQPVSFEPTKLNRRSKNPRYSWNIKTYDGRKLSMLSTGQRSQLAFSLVLGLNLALGDVINHDIIALDDTSAAFDMAQLAREAIFIRRLAYGAGDKVDNILKRRKQIFIVSHHEGLTHRLIDFLTPPEGKKMHVLNFADWKPEKGPEIEQYNIKAGIAADAKTRERFSNMLIRLADD